MRARRGCRFSNFLRAATLGAAFALMSPAGMPGTAAAETPSVAATSATTPAPAQETTRVLESLPMTPGAPGMPPPQIAAEADRMIIGGAVMLLFAGLAGLTVFMWREVGRRMGTG